MIDKKIRAIYRWLFPILFTFLFLGISSFSRRPILFNSPLVDLTLRIIICIWFFGLFFRLSNFSTFSFNPNIHWNKNDLKVHEKIFYIFMIVLFSTGCGLLTWWLVYWFLPFSNVIRFTISIIIFIIIIIYPMLKNYWVLKI